MVPSSDAPEKFHDALNGGERSELSNQLPRGLANPTRAKTQSLISWDRSDERAGDGCEIFTYELIPPVGFQSIYAPLVSFPVPFSLRISCSRTLSLTFDPISGSHSGVHVSLLRILEAVRERKSNRKEVKMLGTK